jgi:hypothetical protein
MFRKGKTYTREQITAKVGGGTQDCISHAGNRVVAICLTHDMNPQAPLIMLVGNGRDKKRYSEILCNEQKNEAVPIFLKRKPNSWEFAGYFRVLRHSKAPDIISEQQRMAGRNDVYMVIHFEEV